MLSNVFSWKVLWSIRGQQMSSEATKAHQTPATARLHLPIWSGFRTSVLRPSRPNTTPDHMKDKPEFTNNLRHRPVFKPTIGAGLVTQWKYCKDSWEAKRDVTEESAEEDLGMPQNGPFDYVTGTPVLLVNVQCCWGALSFNPSIRPARTDAHLPRAIYSKRAHCNTTLTVTKHL